MESANSYVGRKPPVQVDIDLQSRREAPQTKTLSRVEVGLYTQLALRILEDVREATLVLIPGCYHQTLKEYARDAEEIRHRVASEGIGFLTKTLPAFGKAVDTALSKGSPFEVQGFEIDPETQLPRFLGRLLRMIFVPKLKKLTDLHQSFNIQEDDESRLCVDDQTGERDYVGFQQLSDATCYPSWDLKQWYGTASRLLVRRNRLVSTPQQTAEALKLVRQVCFSFYKLEIPHDEKVNQKVLTDFVACDRELPEEIRGVTPFHDSVIRCARSLISFVLSGSDPLEIIPKHGPGAVATGEKAWEKPVFKRYYSRLSNVYHYDQYFFFNLAHLCDRLQEFGSLESLEVGTAKVELVPKDSRGPRLISCEPLEYQWIQQGQNALLVKTIESHPLTAGRINFTDQGVNRRLSLESSKYESTLSSLVTLDMKEASDRVSLALVKALFPPNWYDALYASRTASTCLPDGTIVNLKKFAPMGSAVCFPVEALIFWAIGVALTCCKHIGNDFRRLRAKLTDRSDRQRGCEDPRSWYVYGDDIICNGENAPDYIQLISTLGLKVNLEKSCLAGLFRESCGVDAYSGINVTPVKFHSRWSSRLTAESFPSWVAYSNLLWEKGYYRSADWLLEQLQAIRVVPVTEQANPASIAFIRPSVLTDYAHFNAKLKYRVNRKLQRREVRATCVVPQSMTGANDGWEEMLRIRSYQGAKPDIVDLDKVDSDPNILQLKAGQYSVRRRAKLVRRWTPLQ